MKVRFQTDADFDRCIVRATVRREPAIDLQLATAARGGAGLRGLPDAQVLAVAAQEGRMLQLTFRTLFWSPEAILAEPPEERGGGALAGLFQTT